MKITNKGKFIIYAIINVLLFTNIFTLQKCSMNKKQTELLEHNIIAITDTVKYYKSTNDKLVANINILQGDMEVLEKTNKSLYDDVKSMKVKNANLITKINGYINNPIKDTTYIIEQDTLGYIKEFNKEFEFKNKYRELSGNIIYNNNNLDLKILNDKVYFDFVTAVKDGKLYIKSDNPYVKYEDITGIQLPTIKKQKLFNVGLQIGVGANYDIINKNIGIGPYVGVGIGINLVR